MWIDTNLIQIRLYLIPIQNKKKMLNYICHLYLKLYNILFVVNLLFPPRIFIIIIIIIIIFSAGIQINSTTPH